MKFDLTNIFDLLADPLSKHRLLKDFQQEVFERILGDEKKPVKKATVLEVITPSPNPSDNPNNSNEQYYAIRAKIENVHECLPDPVDFIKQKKTNKEINKLVDCTGLIYSLNPISSTTNPQGTTSIPRAGDVVEVVEIKKGVYRFDKKVGVVNELIGFIKNEDPSQLDQPAVVDPNSVQTMHAQGSPYVGPSGQASPTLVDQTPVLAAAKRGDFYKKVPGGLPCSSLVAIWVFNQLGLIPKKEEWSDMLAWAKKDIKLWRIINLNRDKEGNKPTVPEPIFNIPAIQERLGGSWKHYPKDKTLPKPGDGPTLTAGKWHISQRWCPPGKSGGLPGGHMYLVYWDGSDKVRYVDSSYSRWYRDLTLPKNSWWGGGCSETLLTLPI